MYNIMSCRGVFVQMANMNILNVMKKIIYDYGKRATCPEIRLARLHLRPAFLHITTITSFSTMTLFQRDPRAGLFFGGDRVTGQEIRDQNGV